MSVTPTLTTGDDSILPVQLLKDDLPFAIDSSATIKASVITKDRKTILLAPVAVLEAASGSDWLNSLVVVKFISANTGTIPIKNLGSNLLEVQVDDGGKLTWFVTLKILQGTIDQ